MPIRMATTSSGPGGGGAVSLGRMPPPNPTEHAGRGLGFDRLVFFSDAVFAIAITLLVLDLKPPLGPGRAFRLAPVLPNLVGFGLSFYVIGRYWLAHHHLFEAIHAYDRRLLTTNLVFLAFIAFLPFPTSVVALGSAESGAVIFYTLSLAAVGLLMIALALVARRPALMRPGQTRGGTVQLVCSMTPAPATFLLSAAVAIDRPRTALWLLLLLIPASWACDRLGGALQRRIDGAPIALVETPTSTGP